MNLNKRTKAVLLMILTAFLFSMMSVFVNLSGDLPTIQKSFFRNSVSAIFAFIILIRSNEKIRMPEKGKKILILRSVLGTVGIFCNFYAVDHLLLADATMLNKMSPFFVIIFSYVFLKENISIQQIIMVLTAFIGSLFVIKPSFDAEMIPFLIALTGGLCAGGAYTCIRKLGGLNVKGPFVVFFFSLFSSLINLPIMLMDFQPMQIQQIIYLLLAGLSAAGAQFSITTAYFNAPAKEISIFDYSQIIFSAALGYLIFNQTIDVYSVIGYMIIISMAFCMFRYNKNQYLKERIVT